MQTVKIEAIAVKSGESSRGTWTKVSIKHSGNKWVSTFDSNMGEYIQNELQKGDLVDLAVKKEGDFWNIASIEKVIDDGAEAREEKKATKKQDNDFYIMYEALAKAVSVILPHHVDFWDMMMQGIKSKKPEEQLEELSTRYAGWLDMTTRKVITLMKK